jgi:hypothetical protein
LRTVGTTKESIATKSLVWFFIKARQVGEGGLRLRTMYFSTVDCRSTQSGLRRGIKLTVHRPEPPQCQYSARHLTA